MARRALHGFTLKRVSFAFQSEPVQYCLLGLRSELVVPSAKVHFTTGFPLTTMVGLKTEA